MNFVFVVGRGYVAQIIINIYSNSWCKEVRKWFGGWLVSQVEFIFRGGGVGAGGGEGAGQVGVV